MQIEKEGDYRNAAGEKVKLTKNWADNVCWPFEDNKGRWYRYNGEACRGSILDMRPSDNIVAEWSDGPVRTETVTTRRIVPGVYGRLEVSGAGHGEVNVRLATKANGGCGLFWSLTAEELDSLAMVASQLAEALRDGK